jgi:hypothetical protein
MTTGVNNTVGKFTISVAEINVDFGKDVTDTGGKFGAGVNAADVNNAVGRFATGVNGNGGAPSVANIFADFRKIEKEQRELSRPRRR